MRTLGLVFLAACLVQALGAPSLQARPDGCAHSARERRRSGCQTASAQSAKQSSLPDKAKKPTMQDVLVNLKLLKSNAVEQSMMVEDGKGVSREHKAFFINYPGSKSGNQAQKPPKKHQEKLKQQKEQRRRRKKPGAGPRESDIYFIRLPAAPYSYVPGLGYVSQPTTFSRVRTPGPNLIQLPLDFVSNGKPVGVRVRPRPPPDSPLVRLDRGPYRLDGRPGAPHLLGEPRPATL